MNEIDTKNIAKRIEEQFDFWPKKIAEMIENLFPPCYAYSFERMDHFRKRLEENILKKLCEFHVTTTGRYDEACKKYNATCCYGLPEKIQKKIFAQNKKDFINCWNSVLPFISEETKHGHFFVTDYPYRMNLLYLAVRSSLVLDYGYFEKIPIGKLFNGRKIS